MRLYARLYGTSKLPIAPALLKETTRRFQKKIATIHSLKCCKKSETSRTYFQGFSIFIPSLLFVSIFILFHLLLAFLCCTNYTCYYYYSITLSKKLSQSKVNKKILWTKILVTWKKFGHLLPTKVFSDKVFNINAENSVGNDEERVVVACVHVLVCWGRGAGRDQG